jgi:hypothetical protein
MAGLHLTLAAKWCKNTTWHSKADLQIGRKRNNKFSVTGSEGKDRSLGVRANVCDRLLPMHTSENHQLGSEKQISGNAMTGGKKKCQNHVKKMARNFSRGVQTISGGLNQSTGWNVSNKFLSPPL